MLVTEFYDFLKENDGNDGNDDFRKAIINNFSFSVAGCRSFRKAGKLHFQQQPDELLGLIDFLRDKNVNSYMEIGLGPCNTILLLDSLFRVWSPDYQESVGIDIEDKSASFTEYQKKFPDCSFVKTNILSYEFTRDYDYIFIDTNQRYTQMAEAYNKCLPHARYIGFHDIAANRWGAKRLFTELSEKHPAWSWSKSGAGIGIVKIKD